MRQKPITWMALLAGVFLFGLVNFHAAAEGSRGNTPVPHLDARGQQGYLDYKTAPSHRAFAIAAGGAWAWVSGSLRICSEA